MARVTFILQLLSWILVRYELKVAHSTCSRFCHISQYCTLIKIATSTLTILVYKSDLKAGGMVCVPSRNAWPLTTHIIVASLSILQQKCAHNISKDSNKLQSPAACQQTEFDNQTPPLIPTSSTWRLLWDQNMRTWDHCTTSMSSYHDAGPHVWKLCVKNEGSQNEFRYPCFRFIQDLGDAVGFYLTQRQNGYILYPSLLSKL